MKLFLSWFWNQAMWFAAWLRGYIPHLRAEMRGNPVPDWVCGMVALVVLVYLWAAWSSYRPRDRWLMVMVMIAVVIGALLWRWR